MNRVTPEGRFIGANTARLVEAAVRDLAAEGEPDERCKSCAGRARTVPNGCLQTQADFVKAVIEGVPFTCHQADRKGWPCHAWFALRVAMKGKIDLHACGWDFSPPDPE